MPDLATFDTLRSVAASVGDKRAYITNRASRRVFDTFLSHSSKDDDLLPGVIKILEMNGAIVYVDDGDNSLPDPPSTETAEILRSRIKKSKRFVLFVTTNSKDSSWIPWELGLGDGLLREYSVALFPSAEKDYNKSWSEQEYLGLYSRIVWGKIKGDASDGWIVYNHHENSAIHLRRWLKGY